MQIPRSIRQELADEAREGKAPREDLLGAGRSAVVFRDQDREGRPVARKVFDSDGLTRAIQFLFLGAPNPYTWNRDAIESALLRRRIVAPLVRFWFGDRLRIARAYQQDWNEDARAFQLHTEFIAGCPPSLDHPFSRQGREQVDELVGEIMRPLQARLEECGFDGLVWQAGRGNPVAMANFLMEPGEGSERRWAWIDLESGVPALFPAQPLELLRFYLPRAFRFGRPLFDDVDIARLRGWLDEHGPALKEALGPEVVAELALDVERLDECQTAWKGQPRYRRSIEYARLKQRISAEQAAFFERHMLLWYGREGLRLVPRLFKKAGSALARVGRWIGGLDYRGAAVGIGRFLTSQKYRRRLAQGLMKHRIESWQRRGHLGQEDGERLGRQVTQRESCAYLTDFGVHMAIKPFIKSIEWLLFPTLFAAGLVSETTLIIMVASGGCAARTLYTLGRLIQQAVKGRERPWVALFVGAVPVLGNLAFPLQIAYSGAEKNDLLAQFMLYDAFTVFGRKIPIWGGRDTLTEHRFNRLPELVLPGRMKPA